MAFRNPLARALTITSADTNVQLLALIRALTGFDNYPSVAHRLLIQADPSGAAAVWRIGNVADLSDTDFGRQLANGETIELGGGGFNSLRLDEIFLRCNLAARTFHIVSEVL